MSQVKKRDDGWYIYRGPWMLGPYRTKRKASKDLHAVEQGTKQVLFMTKVGRSS